VQCRHSKAVNPQTESWCNVLSITITVVVLVTREAEWIGLENSYISDSITMYIRNRMSIEKDLSGGFDHLSFGFQGLAYVCSLINFDSLSSWPDFDWLDNIIEFFDEQNTTVNITH